MKKIVLIIAVLLLFTAISSIQAEDNETEPVVISALEPTITFTPTNPAPLESITFTVSPSPINSSISIEECNGSLGICYPTKTSRPIINGQATVPLLHGNATYINYWITTNGSEGQHYKLNLTIKNSPPQEDDLPIMWIVAGIIVVVVCIVVGYFGLKIIARRKE